MENKTTIPQLNLKVFEEAREAVLKIKTLRRLLTSADLETLEILLDKKTIDSLSRSLEEAKRGKVEPIEKII